jgi:hypothetical protein
MSEQNLQEVDYDLFQPDAIAENLGITSEPQEVIAYYLRAYALDSSPAEVLEKAQELIIASLEQQQPLKKFEHEVCSGLVVEDGFVGTYNSFLRLTPNDPGYLWLIFENKVELGSKPVVWPIGVAISIDDPERPETEEPVDIVHARILYQNTYDTDKNIEVSSKQFQGITNCIHAQVKFNGEECGYYYSF